MTSEPSIPLAAPPVTSASPSTDAFDAIVQAANPSHPNHAAWIENFGGTITPRRASTKDADSTGHLERSESPSRRRRRVSSHNGSSRGALPQFSPDQKDYAGSGKSRSRTHSSGVDEKLQPLSSSTKGQEEDNLHQERRPSEEVARRRRRKKRDKEKEKERIKVPPIPPPRTTSHALHFLDIPPSPPFQSAPASPASFQTSSRGHSNYAESSRAAVTPRSPRRVMPNQSRTISTQLSTNSPLPSNHGSISSAKNSPLQGQFDSEPPMRMSSKVPRAMEANTDQMTTRKADSPTQTVSSRKGSIRSVEFTLPEEPPRRESLDYSIRKSFDALVSPFRSTVKTNNRKTVSPPPKHSSRATILRSSFMDTSFRKTIPSPTANVSPLPKSPSRVADESENRSMQMREVPPQYWQPVEDVTADTTTVPLYPSSNLTPSNTGAVTEEEFLDVQSDVGGNGSLSEEKSHRSNGKNSTIKKKAKKRNVDYNSINRSGTKSTVKPVSGVDVQPEAKVDSSASESEMNDAVRNSLHSEPPTPKFNAGDGVTDQPISPTRQPPGIPFSIKENGVKDQVTSVKVEGLSHASRLPSPEANWREKFEQYALQSPSNPGTGQFYKEDMASSPLSSELLATSESANVNNKSFARQEEFPQKSISRSGGGAFAGVMARMRRDRTASANPLKSSNKNGEANYLEGDSTAASFGLGIATPVNDVMDAAPQRRWRNRLTSFSGKSPKSPKIEEDWKTDNLEAPLPPMPPKALKVLVAKDYSGAPIEVDRDRNRQTLQDSVTQGNNKRGVYTAPLASREFGKISSDFTREVSSPTIHKTLSPALLTDEKHEADEVLSFIGSEGHGEDKRTTWSSLNKLDRESNETNDRVENTQAAPINVQVTRPSMDARSMNDFQERERDAVPMSPPARRSSFSKSKLANLASDGSLRKGAPSNLYVSPTPLPTTPNRKIDPSPIRDEGKQNSPVPRASLDYRMPAWTRGLSRPSISQLGNVISRPSMNSDRDRMPSEFQATSPSSIKESIASPKLGKRFFSSGSKGKSTSKGISSSDYTSPYQLDASKSEIHLGNGIRGQSREEFKEFQGTDVGSKEATKLLAFQMNTMTVSPTKSRVNDSQPSTPTALQHFTTTTEDQNSAFDKMLRQSAKEDAARVKQIANRTAQAHALLS